MALGVRVAALRKWSGAWLWRFGNEGIVGDLIMGLLMGLSMGLIMGGIIWRHGRREQNNESRA